MRAVVVAVAVLLGTAVATASPARPARHVRLVTPHGPVHVYTPPDYDASLASLVVFVHGYATTVDETWQAAKLEKQFEASKLDAMFVAIEAPTTDGDEVSWHDLDELQQTLRAALTTTFPARGHVIAVAHSGGYRTIDEWLPSDDLDTIVLLDAGYSALESYADWLAARSQRRLIDVAELTRSYTDPFHDAIHQLHEALVLDVDRDLSVLASEASHGAQVVYVRSHFGHMELVQNGVALPSILRLLNVGARPSR